MYLVYILRSDNYSYVGMTNDFFRRWRQHNQEIQGGAKCTSRRCEWYPICIIDGFLTMKEAMQCEWKLKRAKGYFFRLLYLSNILQTQEKWTSNSPLIKTQTIIIYVLDEYKYIFPMKTKELVWF